MLIRLAVAAACFLLVTAFSDEDKKKMSAACAASLVTGKEKGRRLPPGLFEKRDAVCGCIGDGMAKDTTVSDEAKAKITKVFELGTQDKRKEARELRLSLDKSVNQAMMKLTRTCVRAHLKPAKKDSGATTGKEGDKKE